MAEGKLSWYEKAARPATEKAQHPVPSPYLERAKIQAEVLVPVLQAFRKEFGEERTNRVAWQALAEFRRQVTRAMSVANAGSAVERFRANNVAMAAIIGDAVDAEILRDSPNAIDMNVTGCRFAQFFRELGEPELGFALTCAFDDTYVEELGGGEVTLTRTGTIMRGADHCDFRYALKKAGQA